MYFWGFNQKRLFSDQHKFNSPFSLSFLNTNSKFNQSSIGHFRYDKKEIDFVGTKLWKLERTRRASGTSRKRNPERESRSRKKRKKSKSCLFQLEWKNGAVKNCQMRNCRTKELPGKTIVKLKIVLWIPIRLAKTKLFKVIPWDQLMLRGLYAL